MHLVLTILAAVIPSLLLIAYFYARDRRPEPHSALLWTFFLGILTVIPVLAIGLPAMMFMPTFETFSPTTAALLQAAYMAFICAAIPEELCKFAVLMGYSSRQRAFNEPMDGVVYGAVASLGFATLENVLYVGGGSWGMAIARCDGGAAACVSRRNAGLLRGPGALQPGEPAHAGARSGGGDPDPRSV